jgi:phosphoenolpyruvate---glycerone phosphotransferase subunit DhaK
MKKFINDPDDIVAELLEGFALANPRTVRLTGDRLVARAHPKAEGKVGVVTLGGSGHEPALSGFVGEGLLDVSVPGEIFAAPGPNRCLEAIKLADRGAGVLFVVLNHEGDVMSAKLTNQMVEQESLQVRTLITAEDISSAPRSNPEDRRGLVGCLPVYKIAGAAAEEGRSLDEVFEVAQRMERNMATLSVAVTPATHPATGAPFFALGDDEMEVGMGQHGEAGTGRMKLRGADETAAMMTDQLLADLEAKAGERVLVIVNGSGSTTLMEQFIVYRRVDQVLRERGIEPARALVGEYLTVQEQGGFQLFLARMDDELLGLWDAPCDSPYLTVS